MEVLIAPCACHGPKSRVPAEGLRRPASGSAATSPAAPLGGIRKYEQVQTGQQKKREWEHRQEAERIRVLLLCNGDEVDDDCHRKGHRQPTVGLANPFVPVQIAPPFKTYPRLEPAWSASGVFRYRTAWRTPRSAAASRTSVPRSRQCVRWAYLRGAAQARRSRYASPRLPK